MDLTIRERSQKVFECIETATPQGIEAIANITGLSKSSVHRHQHGIKRRNQYPESSVWETPVGYGWLVRLVLAVIYHFGIKQGVGAESLSAFFQAIHLETHVGSSPSALRSLKQQVNEAIVAYESAQAEHCQPTSNQGICVGADETFFGLPILVLIELASGFIFTEVEGENRTYTTWVEHIQSWWEQKQWQCHFLVSDGAPALIKLALSGLGCVNVSDLFHAMQALGRPMGSALGRQVSALEKQTDHLEQQLSQASDHKTIEALKSQLETTTQQQQSLAQAQHTYHAALEEISQTIHPFTLDTFQWQLFDEFSTRLTSPLASLSEVSKSYGGESAQKAIATFQTHISSFAQGIHAWWNWVTLALPRETQDIDLQNWILIALLPWVYWLKQADKTRHPHLKHRYQQAASDAYDLLMAHPMTLQLYPSELLRWVHWSQDMCAHYQRTSSAVEGRNGYLSKLHHARRGFSEQSLKVLTIIHNFDIKRADGSTPAQRLFGHHFPDLFEWILDNITELPMPRRSSKIHQPDSLHREPFPA